MKRLRISMNLFAGLALLLWSGVLPAAGFAEEDLRFIDPYSGTPYDGTTVSTIHDDLTYALALAAGFSEADAHTLQIYNQLVDSEYLAQDGWPTYTNCSGSFVPPPGQAEVIAAGCPADTNFSDVIWPMTSSMQNPVTCATSRFGVYSPFFHFPHNYFPFNTAEVTVLHDWAWGLRQDLPGYAAYAWDGASVLTARCTYRQPVVHIDTGLPAGSLPAFATYLHSYADSFSHDACLKALDALNPPAPWGTHTQSFGEDIYACNYNPMNPTNTDAHGREFGTAHPADTARTRTAIQAVYAELALRSLQREGLRPPLALDTPLTVDGSPTTLQQALDHFVTTWEYDQEVMRRLYVQHLVAAIQALPRVSLHRVRLPILMK